MAKKQDTAPALKKEEVKEEMALYSALFELREYYGQFKCKIETPNDITKISDRQAMFDKAIEGFTQKVNEGIPEELTDEEKGKKRQEAAEKFLYTESTVTRKSLQFFTFDEFLEGVKDMPLTNKQISFMSYWLVKPQEDEKTTK